MYKQPHTHATWHLADAVDQSEQSIVTVDQSELSIDSVKCEFTKFAVFSTCSLARGGSEYCVFITVPIKIEEPY